MKIICLPVGKVHDYDSLYVLRQNYCWIGKKIEKKGGRKKKKGNERKSLAAIGERRCVSENCDEKAQKRRRKDAA